MACIRKRRGKWVADYRDGAGIRRWNTFETKRAAEDFLDEERPKTRQWTRPAVHPNVTIRAYKDRWLKLIGPTIKARTVASYTQSLVRHILPALGDMPIRQLDRGRIKAFLAEKLTSGLVTVDEAGKPQRPECLSRNSVRIIHGTLRSLLNAAIDDRVIVSNPASKLGKQLHLVVPKATRQEQIKAMTREQRQTFLKTAARVSPRYYPLFAALAGTGMRLGEALGLQWEDVDVLAREIRIARSFSRGQVETPKSGHGRTVDISQMLAETLTRLEVTRKQEKLKYGWPEIPPWVLCSKEGTAIDESHVRRAMRAVLKDAKLPAHFSPHCLRHTYASLLLQQGESMVYVQRQLGHANISLTVDTYGKWLPIGNKAAVDRLDAPPQAASGSKLVAAAGSGEGTDSEVIEISGGPCRDRTCGPLIKSQLLYHLS